MRRICGVPAIGNTEYHEIERLIRKVCKLLLILVNVDFLGFSLNYFRDAKRTLANIFGAHKQMRLEPNMSSAKTDRAAQTCKRMGICLRPSLIGAPLRSSIHAFGASRQPASSSTRLELPGRDKHP